MNEKRKYLYAVQMADFAVNDTRLFLDTHPNDEAALAAMKCYRKKAAIAREEYEKRFGPLTIFSEGCGEWTADPWPWNYC